MTYWPSLRTYNENHQSMTTGRMMSVWLNNRNVSVRGLAEQAEVGSCTSRKFLAWIKNPSATLLCKVKDGFSCSYGGRVFQSGQRLQLQLSEYLKRQVQVEVISFR